MIVDIHDVGHGACAVVTCPNGARLMFDCGFGREPWWFPSAEYSSGAIDLLAITNLDEDHADDLPRVWRDVEVRAIFSNPSVDADALAAMKAEHGMDAGVQLLHAILSRRAAGMIGQPPVLGNVQAWAHWNRYGIDYTDTNNLSLAVFVRYGAFTILFAGDLESAGWRSLLQRPTFRAALATVRVLVASHHGRKSGCCAEAFQFFRPEIVVFSDDAQQYESQVTDGWYRPRTSGIIDLGAAPDPILGYPKRHILTTRRDGTMRIGVRADGSYLVTPSRRTPRLSPLAMAFMTLAA